MSIIIIGKDDASGMTMLLYFFLYLSKIRKVVTNGQKTPKGSTPNNKIFCFKSQGLENLHEVSLYVWSAIMDLDSWVWFLILWASPLKIEIYRRLKIGLWFEHFPKMLERIQNHFLSLVIYYPASVQICLPNLHQQC